MWGNLHIAEKRNAMACLVAVVLLLLNNICLAQQTERLPDSVYAADSTVAPFESAAIDTAKSSSGEEEGEIRDTILLRAVPDSSVHRMVSDEDFTYANDPDYWKKEPVTNNAGYWDKFFAWIHSRWFRALLYIVLGSILLFAIFRIVVENKLYLFYRSSPEKRKMLQDDPESISETDLEERIRESIASCDYRSAIRFMYLKALKIADAKSLIHFTVQSTNEAYVKQMKQHGQGENFSFLTRSYEWVWYGGFQPGSSQFESLRSHFENFYQSIEH